ncbi:hypothetical protein [Pseudomonas citronellolis]|uniref:hypothetical protein n=1 Tax=Pseudomonas citronellolis TaxID=53408 RepID=UPI001081427D|nr:hypothetical protein [Pseudomonas citronellolis]MCP1640910.1 hypothetical protein [Pseudomonas citronellolis]MCP1663828.1 hypothetical protein [Pseudomonas citronellolis]MCP1697006.1 hypothetical protein [Pseudomonas citronellolis]MCP1701360.1 hypothetical protein [Pseudomonas citronellolis]MCP1795615.1 hypothetical protein [Pseudomonas citronellolis]
MKKTILLSAMFLVAACASTAEEGVLFSVENRSYLLTRECVKRSEVSHDLERHAYIQVELTDPCATSLAGFLNAERGALLSVSVKGQYLSRSLPILGEFQARSLRISSPDTKLAIEVERLLSPPR